MLYWYIDYYELKAIETLPAHEKHVPLPLKNLK